MARDSGITVPCKNCGKPARPEDLTLDPGYKMMVCPMCVKARKDSERVKKELAIKKEERQQAQEAAKAEEVKRPAGWDAEDEYLEKLARQKAKMQAETATKVERIDATKVKYTCPKCKYTFAYDTVKKRPFNCPYCSQAIASFRV